LWVLVAVALTGSLSAEVIESGAFTSLELSMLAGRLDGNALARGFGWYNAIAAAAGSLGALSAALPQLARTVWDAAPADQSWFLVLIPVAATGILIAGRLSGAVEAPGRESTRAPLGPSRSSVTRLAGLFAIDAFGGGFVVQAFVAFWLIDRFNASTATIGALFAAAGVMQTVSFLIAPVLSKRFGLLNTMVFTHLPSNLFLAGVAFAPNLPVAAGLLLGRAALSQMDIPTRQAYVLTLVRPEERTAAIAYTNTARYLVRPIGPVAGAAALALGPGAPFLLAGLVKSLYDMALWFWFRTVPLTAGKESAP
jgi:predicted MFS family arabinose efflux permease